MLYTDPKSYQLYGKENAIVVLNHSYEIDFLCGWSICDKFGVLGVRESIPNISTFAPFYNLFFPVPLHAFNLSLFPELKSDGQKRAELYTYYWLDVVFPGDSFLHKEMGGGSKDGGSESSELAGLPRKLLGMFQLVEINMLMLQIYYELINNLISFG